MNELCTKCGGKLKAEGKGFKCSFCGAAFDSIDELRPKQASRSAGYSTSSASHEAQKFDHGVDVFDANINAVLEITWSDDQYRHSGSGFLIDRSGYAITNTHVVTHEDGKSCKKVNVRIAGEMTTADILMLGDKHHGDGNGDDLALIKLNSVPSKATTVKFEDFENVKNGERIFVIGNSLGYGTCITSGIVSDRLRDVNGHMLLMTDCAINGGNSGGPIFNEGGRVIAAVVSGITSAEGMNFAIPSDTIREFINKYSTGAPLKFAFDGFTDDKDKEKRKAIAPCPKCGSWNTYVENSIFVCESCDYTGG